MEIFGGFCNAPGYRLEGCPDLNADGGDACPEREDACGVWQGDYVRGYGRRLPRNHAGGRDVHPHGCGGVRESFPDAYGCGRDARKQQNRCL